MTDFPPYPTSNAAEPGTLSDRYVVAVSCNVDEGLLGPDPITEPMTYEAAQQLLTQVAAGEVCSVLPDGADLVAEVAPGHLIAHLESRILSRSKTYDVRIARLLPRKPAPS